MRLRTFVIAGALWLSACASHPNVMPLGMISMIQVSDACSYAECRQPYVLTDHALYCYAPTSSVLAIPKGYVTDFASIPDGFDWLINPSGRYATGAIIHDYLFAVGRTDDRAGFNDANDVLDFYMREFKVRRSRRAAVNFAVGTDRAFKSYGHPNEWNNRFADPLTGDRVSPPFPNPETAVFRNDYDCNEFEDDYWRLHDAYAGEIDRLKEQTSPTG